MTARFGPLVEADWLSEHLGDPDLRVIDFRWYLDRPGRAAYESGHIPGAVFVDLWAVSGTEGPGRHPLPTAAQFEAEMRRAGVGPETRVVVYDDAGGSIAARLWFLLGWFGHAQRAVLDGGITAWDGPLETQGVDVPAGDFRSREPDRSRIVDFEEVANRRGGVLLDARAGDRFRGENEPVDPKAGHIPGARNAPWAGNLGADGRFKQPEELRRRFAELGVDDGAEVISYCGSGVTACHNLLAMELAGIDGARLYEGSWSDWSRRDGPVATGD